MSESTSGIKVESVLNFVSISQIDTTTLFQCLTFLLKFHCWFLSILLNFLELNVASVDIISTTFQHLNRVESMLWIEVELFEFCFGLISVLILLTFFTSI